MFAFLFIFFVLPFVLMNLPSSVSVPQFAPSDPHRPSSRRGRIARGGARGALGNPRPANLPNHSAPYSSGNPTRGGHQTGFAPSRGGSSHHHSHVQGSGNAPYNHQSHSQAANSSSFSSSRGGFGSGAGRGRFGAPQASRTDVQFQSPPSRSGLTNLEVSGYPEDLTYEEFVQFLTNFGPRNFRFVRLDFKAQRSRLQVQSGDAQAILALTGKSIRPTFSLLVEHATSGRPLQPHEKDSLRTVIKAKFIKEANTLDLSNLEAQMPRVDFNNKMFVNEIGIIIAEEFPQVATASFANNRITSLAGFSRLSYSVPALINFSFENNLLTQLEQLDHLLGFRDSMRELILKGNPVVQSFSTEPLLYHHLISALFPNLQILDGDLLRPIIEFDLPPMKSLSALPAPQGSFFESDSALSISKAFIEKYFEIYDNKNERQKLVSVYHENAQFSLSAASDVKFALLPAEYSNINRNILALGTRNRSSASAALLRTGPVLIAASLAGLPSSRHDVAAFTADVFFPPLSQGSPNLLFINLRGSFLETDSSTIRSFHRVFLCGPPTADSTSKGWAVSVVNDELFIGAGKSFQNVPPTLGLGQSQSLSPLPPLNLPLGPLNLPLPHLGHAEQQLVQTLMQTAGIDQTTAVQALMQAGGNLDQAVKLVQTIGRK